MRGGRGGLWEGLRGRAGAGRGPGTAVVAMPGVLRARELAQGNVNPQLVAAVMADELGMAEAGK